MDMEMTPPCPDNVTNTVMRYRGVAREKLYRLGALLKSSLERFLRIQSSPLNVQ